MKRIIIRLSAHVCASVCVRACVRMAQLHRRAARLLCFKLHQLLLQAGDFIDASCLCTAIDTVCATLDALNQKEQPFVRNTAPTPHHGLFKHAADAAGKSCANVYV